MASCQIPASLTGNQRNGFLNRVEERAAYRFLLRIVRDSLTSTEIQGGVEGVQSNYIGLDEETKSTHTQLLQQLRDMGNLTWMVGETKADRDVDEDEGENDGKDEVTAPSENEEVYKRSLQMRWRWKQP